MKESIQEVLNERSYYDKVHSKDQSEYSKNLIDSLDKPHNWHTVKTTKPYHGFVDNYHGDKEDSPSLKRFARGEHYETKVHLPVGTELVHNKQDNALYGYHEDHGHYKLKYESNPWDNQKEIIQKHKSKEKQMKESIQDLIVQVGEKNYEDAQQTFSDIFSQKLSTALENLKVDVAQEYFGDQVVEEGKTYKKNNPDSFKWGKKRGAPKPFDKRQSPPKEDMKESVTTVRGKSYGNQYDTDEDGNEISKNSDQPKAGRGRPKSDETIQQERGQERSAALAANPMVPKVQKPQFKSAALIRLKKAAKPVKFDLDKNPRPDIKDNE